MAGRHGHGKPVSEKIILDPSGKPRCRIQAKTGCSLTPFQREPDGDNHSPSGCTVPNAQFKTVFGNRPSQKIPAMAAQMKHFAGTDS
jgi:hypothetical protein